MWEKVKGIKREANINMREGRGKEEVCVANFFLTYDGFCGEAAQTYDG